MDYNTKTAYKVNGHTNSSSFKGECTPSAGSFLFVEIPKAGKSGADEDGTPAAPDTDIKLQIKKEGDKSGFMLKGVLGILMVVLIKLVRF